MIYKHGLFELNQSLWIGSLAKEAQIVVPFNDLTLQEIKAQGHLQNYQQQYLYHRSAIPSLVMNSLTSQMRVNSEQAFGPPKALGEIVA
jgi:hypothetical protein